MLPAVVNTAKALRRPWSGKLCDYYSALCFPNWPDWGLHLCHYLFVCTAQCKGICISTVWRCPSSAQRDSSRRGDCGIPRLTLQYRDVLITTHSSFTLPKGCWVDTVACSNNGIFPLVKSFFSLCETSYTRKRGREKAFYGRCCTFL